MREGRTAEKQMKDKKVDEKSINRGFDIVRTWGIQSYMDLDNVVTDSL